MEGGQDTWEASRAEGQGQVLWPPLWMPASQIRMLLLIQLPAHVRSGAADDGSRDWDPAPQIWEAWMEFWAHIFCLALLWLVPEFEE